MRPELLSALEARGTVFLPPGSGKGSARVAAAVEEYCRLSIEKEATEDSFYV